MFGYLSIIVKFLTLPFLTFYRLPISRKVYLEYVGDTETSPAIEHYSGGPYDLFIAKIKYGDKWEPVGKIRLYRNGRLAKEFNTIREAARFLKRKKIIPDETFKRWLNP